MISVLILDGFSDSTFCSDSKIMSEVSGIYIPLLTGILRFNGIKCETVCPKGLERQYKIVGDCKNNIVYAPVFSCAKDMNAAVSFIYTDSTDGSSESFRIASKLRNEREELLNQVVFVNQLQESNSLKSFYPVIVDEIRFSKTAPICDVTEKLYIIALGFCSVLCRHNGIIFKDPAVC